ncbi:Permease of the drug/metabolite transporter (DMT) superfamily [Sulfitobacter noctilucicola]|uniref:Drug/metabolite transporter (DMT)-like permease n=1 Tax=Sulfitobacter noctilucicola TaxID=1342301 RepID=A0A7W6Q375_9RHOB|nr:DMT family transporter [Sulfitobacter noctilucicola]KIN62642.1 Permease of the drug/metabolite transporter (DMT) superfamily [Sulfitobacter noctilucicola]MBB4172824.1 drug/metabolite transporter (DMT)-like permease [Sulfitobacter noctilucicola]
MDIRAILLGLVFAIMWSSAFTSARIIVADMSPLFALSCRYLISGLLGVGIALALGQSMRLTPAQWRATIIFGILQNAVYLGLNFVAMQTVEASLAAIIASTMPLLVGFAAWVVLGEKLKPLGVIGLIAGVIGVSIIMGARLGGGVDMMGVALCVVGVIALTAATLLVRGATSGGNFLMIVGLQMLVGCVALALATLAFETPRINPSWPLFFAFTYTCLIPGLAATIIWFWLVNRIGATRAATFHFLNPFFGVAIASLLLSETLGSRDILGVTIITIGILAVQISRQKNA